jgi:hypothetical protein
VHELSPAAYGDARRVASRKPDGADDSSLSGGRRRAQLAYVYDVLRRAACADCGERDPLVLEFDHIDDKRAGVTRLAWYGCSLATIDAEIAKCEVRCANCHRRATAARGGHFRFRVLSSASPP